jgi:hypothetical protein
VLLQAARVVEPDQPGRRAGEQRETLAGVAGDAAHARPVGRIGGRLGERIGALHDRHLAAVEDAGGQGGLGTGALEHLDEVLRAAGAAGGDHRNADRGAHRGDQLQVEAGAGAVAVDAVEQDLAGAELLADARQLHRVDVAALAPAA